MKKMLLCAALFSVALLQAQKTYLHCGKILDTESGEILNEKTLVISDGKIIQVADGYITPEDTGDIVDLSGKTVLPGLVDMHVHLEHETNPKRYLARYTENEADVAFESTLYARKTLMAGFTTVRDLGGSGINTALRNAIKKGYVVGPRIFSAGKSIATTGGHADPTNGSRKDLMGDPGPREGVINSPEEARKAVRQRYKNGADVIKITATGGVLSVAKSGHNPQFFLDEVKAITETAADYGMLVAAHAHGDEGMQRAILGGVKTIEHGTFMSEETMDMMKKYDVYYVPTIIAGKEVAEKAEIEGYFPDLVVPKAREVGPKIQSTFAKAYKRGVKIAFGTDAGVFKHGDNAKEFQYMVEVGMPEAEAIRSATVTPAMLLGMKDQIGQLKKGYIADIIAVNDDPTKNIETLRNVIFVMKEGVIYKNKSTEP